MTSKFSRVALILFALGEFVAVPMLNAHPTATGNVMDAIVEVKQAVDHGKQGHTEMLVTHARKSLNYAERGGKNSHLKEAIMQLQEAIGHARAGHAEVATEHAEAALSHLTEVTF